jgi:hypothetical protein
MSSSPVNVESIVSTDARIEENNIDPKKLSPSQNKMHLYTVFILNHLISNGTITTDFDPFTLDIQLLHSFQPSEFNSLYKKKVKSIQNALISSPKPNIVNNIVQEFYDSSSMEAISSIKNKRKYNKKNSTSEEEVISDITSDIVHASQEAKKPKKNAKTSSSEEPVKKVKKTKNNIDSSTETLPLDSVPLPVVETSHVTLPVVETSDVPLPPVKKAKKTKKNNDTIELPVVDVLEEVPPVMEAPVKKPKKTKKNNDTIELPVVDVLEEVPPVTEAPVKKPKKTKKNDSTVAIEVPPVEPEPVIEITPVIPPPPVKKTKKTKKNNDTVEVPPLVEPEPVIEAPPDVEPSSPVEEPVYSLSDPETIDHESDDEEEVEIEARPITIDNIKYLIDADCILYEPETYNEVGVYNYTNNSIVYHTM